MKQDEIKAMKDHAANGGFTSPYKVSALIAEVRRLERELHINPEAEIGRLNARLETEILRRDSLGEALDNVVADHKRDIARLADIKAKVAPIIEYLEGGEVKDMTVKTGLSGPGYLPKSPISIVDVEALATALEDGEEREAYKQVIDWGRGLANQVLEMVNLHYTEKEETFKPFAILPPMSQLLSYYAATLNEWIGKLIGEEPK